MLTTAARRHPVAGRDTQVLRTLIIVLLAALTLAADAAFAAAPVSFDQDVSDMTPWLKPFAGPKAAADTDKTGDENKRWLSLELTNPTKQELHRIITLEPGGSGVLRFLDGAGPAGLSDHMADGEGGTAAMLNIGGSQAVDIRLSPLATSTFALYSEGPIATATWRMWLCIRT